MDFSSLSAEVKEKARLCTTTEELLKLAEEEGIELSDEDLGSMSGGIEWSEQKLCPPVVECETKMSK